jgi:ribosomal protein L18
MHGALHGYTPAGFRLSAASSRMATERTERYSHRVYDLLNTEMRHFKVRVSPTHVHCQMFSKQRTGAFEVF